ncbi:universal stress protein [Caulobacter sp. 1776]|uniref:universal stress protein n=1 Tax=Caulobacter sp. 1776 TaxID=3156420 RepID=UPI00339B3D1C
MKTVLLLVHDDVGQEARLQTALDLTRSLDGHLTCVDVTPTPIFAGDIGGAAQAMVLAEERKVETANRATLQTRLSQEAVAWDWIDATGDFTRCLMQEAGLSDLIVVNSKRDTWRDLEPRGVVASILTQARCPVVAAPDHVRGFDASGAAMVAWDGSEAVATTLRACVPLLKLASSVRLFTVEDVGEGASAEAAALYLSEHGIHAEVDRMAADGAKPDDLILTACAALDISYCVMGAFGHGRLTEEVFGGVTRRMLDAAQLPLVMGR